MRNKVKRIIYPVFIFAISIIFITSCGRKGPLPFEVHEDECIYCKMRLNDLRFAAQTIEDGNLIRKYCSIECMFAYIQEKKPKQHADYVMDYLGSGIIEAEKVFYLISPGTPSPMGLDIAAFRNNMEREKILKKMGGKKYTYNELMAIDIPKAFKKMTDLRMKEFEKE